MYFTLNPNSKKTGGITYEEKNAQTDRFRQKLFQ